MYTVAAPNSKHCRACSPFVLIIHFLITGYLFVQALIGVDPVPYKAPYPLRLILLLGTSLGLVPVVEALAWLDDELG